MSGFGIGRAARAAGWILYSAGLVGIIWFAFAQSPMATVACAIVLWLGDALLGGKNSLRSALRGAALIAASSAAKFDPIFAVLIVVIVIAQGSRLVYAATTLVARTRAASRPRWRNLAAGTESPSEYREPLAARTGGYGPRIILLGDIFAIVGMLVFLSTGSAATAIAGAALAVAIAVAIVCGSVWQLVVVLAEGRIQASWASVKAAVGAMKPSLVIHDATDASSDPSSLDWVELIGETNLTVIVIVREPSRFDATAGLGLPTVLVPKTVDARLLHTPSMRACFYGTHSSFNRQFTRFRSMLHVFVGPLGEAAGYSPRARVYDEIWVPDARAREKYERLEEGIDPQRLRVVGPPGGRWLEQFTESVVRSELADAERKKTIAQFRAALP